MVIHMNDQRVSFTSNRSTFLATAQSSTNTLQISAVFTKEGVQNGGFKPRDELQKAALWMEHRPIVLNHPKINGQPTTVSDLTNVIGYTSDITFDEEKAAITGTCNIWTDEAPLSLVQGLLDGSVKEGSVGFWYRPEAGKGAWNGEEYREVQRDLLFDHYALLVDYEGACSHAEGCGLRMNREDAVRGKRMGTLRSSLINRINRTLKGPRLSRDSALPPREEPTAPKDQPWSFDPSEYTLEELRRACAWFDVENSDSKEAYKLPHHLPDGRVVWRGVTAAAAALVGARGGVDIPQDDIPRVKEHLDLHYRQFDEVPPWANSRADSLAVDSEGLSLEAEKRELQRQLDALTRAEDERRLKEREKLLADITIRTGDNSDLYSSWTIDQLRVLDDLLRHNVDRTVKGIPSKSDEKSGLTVGRWDPHKKEWII